MACVLLLAATAGRAAAQDAPGALADPTDLTEIVERVFSDERYQRELPEPRAQVPPPDSPDRTQPTTQTNPEEDGGGTGGLPNVGFSAGGMIATVFTWLMWGAMAIGVIVLIIWLVRTRAALVDPTKEARRDVAKGRSVDARAPDAGLPGDDADALALAAEGDYDAAVHALLLAALGSLFRSGRAERDDALTSRELLEVAQLEDESRDSLGTLVATVERSHFGGRPLTRDDFDSSHRRYECLQLSDERP